MLFFIRVSLSVCLKKLSMASCPSRSNYWQSLVAHAAHLLRHRLLHMVVDLWLLLDVVLAFVAGIGMLLHPPPEDSSASNEARARDGDGNGNCSSLNWMAIVGGLTLFPILFAWWKGRSYLFLASRVYVAPEDLGVSGGGDADSAQSTTRTQPNDVCEDGADGAGVNEHVENRNSSVSRSPTDSASNLKLCHSGTDRDVASAIRNAESELQVVNKGGGDLVFSQSHPRTPDSSWPYRATWESSAIGDLVLDVRSEASAAAALSAGVATLGNGTAQIPPSQGDSQRIAAPARDVQYESLSKRWWFQIFVLLLLVQSFMCFTINAALIVFGGAICDTAYFSALGFWLACKALDCTSLIVFVCCHNGLGNATL